MILISLIGIIIGVILGGIILFAGRKTVWITLGIVGLTAAADLAAVLIADLDSGRDLLAAEEWELLAVAFIAGILGLALGRVKPNIAVLSIGLIAGADAALWFYDISNHLTINVADQSEQTAYMVGLVVIAVGGLVGLWLVRKIRDEALIFITMLVGAQLIQNSLGFSPTSSWTAIIIISLALAGVLVQYAVYLRELKADQMEPEPLASSMAYFQDLELDI